MNNDDIKALAHLARIEIPDHELDQYTDINDILDFVEQIKQVDVASIEPLFHPLDTPQRLQPDIVTEVNRREELQTIAPHNTQMGLYFVPKVLDNE